MQRILEIIGDPTLQILCLPTQNKIFGSQTPSPKPPHSQFQFFFKNFLFLFYKKTENAVKPERKLMDVSDYKHEYSSFQRKPIEMEEVDAINNGGKFFQWRGIKKIKIVKEEED